MSENHQLHLEIRYLSSALDGRKLYDGLSPWAPCSPVHAADKLEYLGRVASLLAWSAESQSAAATALVERHRISLLVYSADSPADDSPIPDLTPKIFESDSPVSARSFTHRTRILQYGLHLVGEGSLSIRELHRWFLRTHTTAFRRRFSAFTSRWSARRDVADALIGFQADGSKTTSLRGGISFEEYLHEHIFAAMPQLTGETGSILKTLDASTFPLWIRLIGVALREIRRGLGDSSDELMADLEHVYVWTHILAILCRNNTLEELFGSGYISSSCYSCNFSWVPPDGIPSDTFILDANYLLPENLHRHLCSIVSWFRAIAVLGRSKFVSTGFDVQIEVVSTPKCAPETDEFRGLDALFHQRLVDSDILSSEDCANIPLLAEQYPGVMYPVDKSSVHPEASLMLRAASGDVFADSETIPTLWPVATGDRVCCWTCQQLGELLVDKGTQIHLNFAHLFCSGWALPPDVPVAESVLQELRNALFERYLEFCRKELNWFRPLYDQIW
ncbi:hypothetical protein MKEN_00142100 [Mycena kentingensis (nom. inval.)]|nr:hypothetical protein MKEN_00142100 [Mycena kentingensis (nom. inval.)]